MLITTNFDMRGLRSLFGASSAAKPSTPKPIGLPRPSAPVNATCKVLPLTRDTWKTLNLDQYLQTYPGGNHLTVAQYAALKGAPNFDCGVGNKCNANQVHFLRPWKDICNGQAARSLSAFEWSSEKCEASVQVVYLKFLFDGTLQAAIKALAKSTVLPALTMVPNQSCSPLRVDDKVRPRTLKDERNW
ncbi:hypothetical protein VP01_4052g4 [Puccinia sorghi]|uniref:Uncharacterized protein n=1 Tax=Puccinia sorghi TaxID=27349 RepID=A0A0L6USH4_9BASI|nr:hypothetical protein VP01_4052g4 [Puccinia sorghi]